MSSSLPRLTPGTLVTSRPGWKLFSNVVFSFHWHDRCPYDFAMLSVQAVRFCFRTAFVPNHMETEDSRLRPGFLNRADCSRTPGNGRGVHFPCSHVKKGVKINCGPHQNSPSIGSSRLVEIIISALWGPSFHIQGTVLDSDPPFRLAHKLVPRLAS